MTDAIASPAAAASGAAMPAKGKLATVAKQFEAVFLRQMIGSMRQAGLSDELFDSSASDQFRDMADSHLADDMAGKGFGIAQLLTRQLGGGTTAAAPAGTFTAASGGGATP